MTGHGTASVLVPPFAYDPDLKMSHTVPTALAAQTKLEVPSEVAPEPAAQENHKREIVSSMREQHCTPQFYFDGKENITVAPGEEKEVLARSPYVPPQWQRGGLDPENPRDRLLHPERFHPLNQLGLPDRSFDLDGDGVVDQRDLFFANMFDKDRDGKLNSEEREAALKALNGGLADTYMFLPEKGVKKCNENDFGNRNQGWADMTRLIKNHEGGTHTYSKLHNGRRERAIQENENVRQLHEMHHPPRPVEFRRPITESSAGTKKVMTLLDEPLERRRTVRAKNGMLPITNTCNPHREAMVDEMQYATLEDPKHRNTGEVYRSRKETDLAALEQVRAKNMGSFVPAAERIRRQWNAMLDERAKSLPDKTLPKLLDARAKERRQTGEQFMQKRFANPRTDIPQHFETQDKLYTSSIRETSEPDFKNPARVSYDRLSFVRMTHKDMKEYMDPTNYPDDPYNQLQGRILMEIDPMRRPVTEKIVNDEAPELPKRDRETFAEFATRRGLGQDDLIIPAKGPEAEEGFFERLMRQTRQPSLADEMPLYSSFSKDFIFREPVLPTINAIKKTRPLNVYAKSLVTRPKTPPPRFPRGPAPLSMTDTILARGGGIRHSVRTSAFQDMQ